MLTEAVEAVFHGPRHDRGVVTTEPPTKESAMTRFLLDAWPLRRRLALLALLPLVAGWFVIVGRGSSGVPRPGGWYVAVAAAAVLGAAVLATYVPHVGRRPDLGCTPCAGFSGLTLLGATTAIRTYDGALLGPLVAGALLLFGLTQRMGQPATCEAPVRRSEAEVHSE
jgi:hypothetical protein